MTFLQLMTDECRHKNSNYSSRINASWFRKIFFQFAYIKWRNSKDEPIFEMLDYFHRELMKLELIDLVAVDDGQMSTQKCRPFPQNYCKSVTKDIATICWAKMKSMRRRTYLWNYWLFPSRIDEVKICSNLYSWRRTNVDTEMQTIPPELLRVGFERYCWHKIRASRDEPIFKMLEF